MNKIILLTVTLLLASYQTIGQILPIEYLMDENTDDVPENINYLKDVNNKLDKFIGIWKGTKDSISYEFHVEKMLLESKDYKHYKQDGLVLRYKVTSASGIVIENTLDLELNNKLVCEGLYLRDEYNAYYFFYFGREPYCGQIGKLIIQYSQHYDRLSIFKGDIEMSIDLSKCSTGTVQKIIPESKVFLTKFIEKNGWENNGNVTTTLDNGRLKVSDVNNTWEGIRKPLDDLTFESGKILDISLNFDKGTTNAPVRLYVQEKDNNGNHLSWNVINGNLQTGSYHYEYIVKKGTTGFLRIDKSNTHLNETTDFYVDNTTIVVKDKPLIVKKAVKTKESMIES